MLPFFRHAANYMVILLGITLTVMWLSGAHGHRPLANHGHAHAQGLHGHYHHAHDDLASAADRSAAQAADAGLSIHVDHFSDIELIALLPPSGQPLGDLPLLALLICAAFVLRRADKPTISPLPDPPWHWRSLFALRPPLRGPPLPA